jgi:hypothetical protein
MISRQVSTFLTTLIEGSRAGVVRRSGTVRFRQVPVNRWPAPPLPGRTQARRRFLGSTIRTAAMAASGAVGACRGWEPPEPRRQP